MTFDIAAFDTRTLSEQGLPMQILHPRTGSPMLGKDGKPVTITLQGPNSTKFKELRRNSQLRRADMAARGVQLTDEDLKAERQDYLVHLTKSWTFDEMAGQPFPFTPSNAVIFYADERWEWVTNAAWQFVNNDGAFLPSS